MFDVMPDRLPWWIAGPSLGLLVAGLFAVANQPLGASGAYVQTLGFARRVADVAVWRVWYFAGMFLGGFVVTQILREGAEIRSGYDALRDAAPLWLVVPAVFAGATVMGYGASMAGGCTSGHGICGTSQRSKASFVVTGTFMAAAVATTGLLTLLTGGDL